MARTSRRRVDAEGGAPVVRGCDISGKRAEWYGGGIACESGTDATFADCTIATNRASSGSSGRGAGIQCASGATASFANAIVWGNDPDAIDPGNGEVSATYSAIEGGWTGEGNIDANPRFLGSGDHHLAPSSPCIDTARAEDGTQCDLDGDPRPEGAGDGMGADEADSEAFDVGVE